MLIRHNSSDRQLHILSLVVIASMIVGFIAPVATHTAYALDVPQPIYPEDYSNTTPMTDPPLGVPSFTWSSVTDATKYRLQVDSEIGFNAPIVMDVTTANTAYTPASANYLFADGEWYWRVRVETPAPIGEWSEVMQFTKTWATYDNKPTLLAPEDNATLPFFTYPDFSWSPVTGAAKYRFQIAESPDFVTTVVSIDTLSTSHQPDDQLSNGEYYWRVVPMDGADHLGTSSDVRSFTMAYGTSATNLVPTLLEPADDTFPTFTPTFHWEAVEGAEYYRLQYSTDCSFSTSTTKDTRQTYYTPTDTFPNDLQYCWRVRVESGPAIGDWSETWSFQKKWYLQPQLLTPTNLYQTGLYPLYSWTPVPGASRYLIQIADNPSFITNPCYEEYTTANTTYAPQSKYCASEHYWWRVKPIDGGGESGLTSAVGEYQSDASSTAPILVYPLYYYLPNDPIYYGENSMNPYEDRTVAFPIFMWHRVIIPSPDGGVYATAYRIQVDTTPYFNMIVWEYDTENTSATPIHGDDFTPTVGQDYYWRVCPLDSMGGNCRTNPVSGLIWWSQIWKARFDPTFDPDDPNPWVLPPTNGVAPALLRPAHGQESVEATPLLEWWPFQDATQYQVEISRDPAFASDVISETVTIPAYTPDQSLAQRSLGRTDYGTFYWRVRGNVAGAWDDWSEVRRFQIASQAEWRYTRTIGDPANQLLIGSDPMNDSLAGYNLTSLYASQSNTHWFLGFNVDISTTDITYVFYVDLDNMDGSGASTPPERDYTVTTIPAHQPEYAIYVDEMDGVINAENTRVFSWNGSAWGFGQTLPDIGGSVYTSTGYVELQLLNGTLGMQQTTSSASVMLFSINTDTNLVEDTVPSDPNVPGSATLSRFSAVSERMNLISPPSTVTGDPRSIPSLLPFFWDWPTGSYPSTPFAGSRLEVHLDAAYTSQQAYYLNRSDSYNTKYLSWNNVTLPDDIVGDNIYYWRVQPRYKLTGLQEAFGAWSGGFSFHRIGFTAQNLKTSVTYATPTFSWDMAEGTNTYRLQVSTDPNFGSTVINQVTPNNSYTPLGTLVQGHYYWRVQVNRYNGIDNDWSQVEQFSLSLPTPTGLMPDQEIVSYAPTFCWDPLIKYNEKSPYEPILTAWKYRVQVSREENFGTIYDSIDTHNNCWTPTQGYLDGTYYWHVAMIDGNSRASSYSLTATYTKQYPITTLISPISGSVPTTPTFIWTPIDGAATYRFEVSLFSTFSPLYDSIVSVNTQYTPIKIYTEAQVYYWRVAIKDRNGNQGPFTDAMIIVDGPITGLIAMNDSPTELGSLTALTATIESGTNVTYAWNYGDGNYGTGPTTNHVYPDVGSYTAIVTATNTISSVMATTMVTIVDVPITGLTATNDSPTEIGSLTTLTATIDSGTNVVFTWDFGDDTNGSGAVVTHTFPAPGNYNATVTAINGTNSSSAVTQVNILDEPITGLSAQNDSPTFLGDTTLLTATIESGTSVIYEWDYGDGSFGSGANSAHLYPDLGDYTATVTATNDLNSMITSTLVTILEEPITGLTATNDSPTFLGEPTHFIATIATGSNVTYLWDFGDGTHGSGATPSHIYDDLGEYTAVVTATNSVSTGTANTIVSVVDALISGLTATNDSPTYLGETTHFTATIATGSNVTYAWDFGDGTNGSGATPSHVYDDLGEYTAVVTATNSVSTGTANTIVSVVDVPIGGLTATNDSPTELGYMTTLTATITSGTHASYAWDFGDGTNGSGDVDTHIYPAAGMYTAMVTASNGTNFATATTLVVITDIPITGLIATNDSPTYLGDTTTLSASIVAGSGVTYAWDFGDGTNGIGQVTAHVYTALGVYNATVTARNSQGDVLAMTEVTIIPPINVFHYIFMPVTIK